MSKIKQVGDIGTPERHARGELIVEVVTNKKVARVKQKSSYELLFGRKTITPEQYLAAERLYFLNLRRMPSHKYTYDKIRGTVVNESLPLSDVMIDSAKSLYNALLNLNDVECDLIVHVILYDNNLTTPAMNSTTKAKRKQILTNALDKIARNFGYIK